MTLRIAGVDKPAAQFLVSYAVTDALSAFPLHSLVSTMTTAINDNAVSMSVQDTLPVLLRMLHPAELAKYIDMTPTALDNLAHYAASVDNMARRLWGDWLECMCQVLHYKMQLQILQALVRSLSYHIQIMC